MPPIISSGSTTFTLYLLPSDAVTAAATPAALAPTTSTSKCSGAGVTAAADATASKTTA